MHSVLHVYNQLISYTWAKLALWHWQVRGNMPTVLLQKSYTEKCFHVHAFPPTQIDQLSNEKSKCDTNLRIIILKMGQETSELVSACFSELQQHKNIQIPIDLFVRNTVHCTTAL